MGSIIKASCECGFESEDLFIGVGFLDVNHDRYLAPAVCLNCHKIFVKNYKKKYPRCSSCRKKVVFYNDPKLQAESKNPMQSDERDEGFSLPDTTYLCPQCEKKTMRFVDIGCWD
jgi:ribosomal protein L37AE/L43A